jgi:hypothetical protein
MSILVVHPNVVVVAVECSSQKDARAFLEDRSLR